MISRGLERFLKCWNDLAEMECFQEGWNAFDRVGIPLYRVGMPSRVLEFHDTGLESFLQGWNAFYRVAMIFTGMECFLERWNAFNRVGIPFYRIEMHSRGLECFQRSWNTFVQG
jgi:hypothetical protein